MRELEKGHVAQLLSRVTEEALKRGIPPDRTPLSIYHADTNSRMLEHGPPPLLTRTQGGFRLGAHQGGTAAADRECQRLLALLILDDEDMWQERDGRASLAMPKL